MCIKSIYDYPKMNNSEMNQYNKVKRSMMLEDHMDKKVKIDENLINITKVTDKKCYGKICDINKNCDYGYIEFKINNDLLLNTLSKNGAITLPKQQQNGKLFFHKNEFYGPLNLNMIGNMVEFDLVHIKTNNNIIAHRIYPIINESFKQINQLSHFQMTEITKFKNDNEQPKFIFIENNVNGKIHKIFTFKNGTGHCILKSDKYNYEIVMMFKEMIGTDISILKEGDNFKFKLFKNNHNGKYIAKSCEYINTIKSGDVIKDNINILGHFQHMELPKIYVNKNENKFTSISFHNIKLNEMTRKITGNIIKLNKRSKCGWFSIDNGWLDENKNIMIDDIFFHEKDLLFIDYNTLNENDNLKFNVLLNNDNNKFIAKNIEMNQQIMNQNYKLSSVSLSQTKNILSNLKFPSVNVHQKTVNSVITGDIDISLTKPFDKLILADKDKRRTSMDAMLTATSKMVSSNR